MWLKTEYYVYAGDEQTIIRENARLTSYIGKADTEEHARSIAQSLSAWKHAVYTVWWPKRGRGGGFKCIATYQDGMAKEA